MTNAHAYNARTIETVVVVVIVAAWC